MNLTSIEHWPHHVCSHQLINVLIMIEGIKRNSNGKQKRLRMLVGSIRSKLEELGNGSRENKLLIQKIDNVN